MKGATDAQEMEICFFGGGDAFGASTCAAMSAAAADLPAFEKIKSRAVKHRPTAGGHAVITRRIYSLMAANHFSI